MTPKEAALCCSQVEDLLDPELFKSLSDPTRLKLLACLARCGRPSSVTELAECCSVDRSVVSRHLAMLEKAGTLESEKQGRTVFYSVRYREFAQRLRNLASAIDECRPKRARKSQMGECCVER